MRHQFARALLAASIAGGATGAVAAGAPAGAITNGGLVGTSWTVTYTWPTNTPESLVWTFYSGRAVVTSYWTGPIVFRRTRTQIDVIYKTDHALTYHCHAVYVGTVDKNAMSGTMSSDGRKGCIPGTGVWFAVKNKAPVVTNQVSVSSPHANGTR